MALLLTGVAFSILQGYLQCSRVLGVSLSVTATTGSLKGSVKLLARNTESVQSSRGATAVVHEGCWGWVNAFMAHWEIRFLA